MGLTLNDIIKKLEISSNRTNIFWLIQYNGIIQELTIKIIGKKIEKFPKLYNLSVKSINFYNGKKYKTKCWYFDLEHNNGGAQSMFLYYSKKGNIFSNIKNAFDYLYIQIEKNPKNISPNAIKLYNNYPEYKI